MIKIDSISKTYKNGIQEIKAIKNLSFSFPDRGLVFVLGKSGSGKSTLLNLLSGLDYCNSGTIEYNGVSLSSLNERQLDFYRQKVIGFVFQEYKLLDDETVAYNISLAAKVQNKPVDEKAIKETLEKVGITNEDDHNFLKQKVKELSGGQKQRVAIARALIKEPEVILADEPTGSLDEDTGSGIFKLLKEISKEKLVIVVSHDREASYEFGDIILELKNGEIINSKETHEIKSLKKEFVVSKPKHISLFDSLIIGAKSFKYKTVRLIMSILLGVVSLSVFTFCFSSSQTDLIKSSIKTAYKYNAKTIELESVCDTKLTSFYKQGKDTAVSNDTYQPDFSEKQLNTLKEKTKIYFLSKEEIVSYHYVGYESLDEKKSLNPYYYFSKNLFGRFVVVDEKDKAEDLYLKPVTNNSVLPSKEDEIAITDYQADIIFALGYKDYDIQGEHAHSVSLNSIDELIGKTIGNKKITGVFSTEESLADFKKKR